jgi:beta-N-acetylhexosaminidase
MQMQGLQKARGTKAASLQSIRAGIDMLCIGNNLLDQEQEMSGIAGYIERCLLDATLDRASVQRSIERVRKRKALLN